MEKTLVDFLWISLASGSGAALVSVCWELWHHYRSRSESVRYLATRLAFAFEDRPCPTSTPTIRRTCPPNARNPILIHQKQSE